jgi:hypothetical protein
MQTKTFVAVIADHAQYYATVPQFALVQHKVGEVGEDLFYTEGNSVHVDNEGVVVVIGVANSFEDVLETCEKCLTRFAIATNIYPGEDLKQLIQRHEAQLQNMHKVDLALSETLKRYITVHA